MEKTFHDVLDMDREGTLVLPDFQRDFVWKTAQQQSLIATFLVQIPINGMLLLEGRSGDFSGKQMCWKKNHLKETENQVLSYLLDGQQRLSTLKNAFSDITDDGDDWATELDNKLKVRWFLRLMPEKGEEDVFGMRSMKFPQGSAALNKLEPSAIEGRLETYPLSKTDSAQWYGPRAQQKDFYRESAAHGLVPLYKLYGTNKHVSTILNRIAMSRMADIQADWEIMDEDLKKEILKNLCDIDEVAKKWVSESPSMDDDDWKDCSNTLSTEWAGAMRDYLSDVMNQKLTFITLKKDEISRAIVIFENLNNSGTALSPYDLIVARAAKCKSYPPLTQRIAEFIEKNAGDSQKDGKFLAEKMGIIDAKTSRMTSTFQKWYLDMLALLIKMPEDQMPIIKEKNVGGTANKINLLFKRTNILNLDSAAIHEKSELAIRSLLRAVTFLNQRCGLCKIDLMGYKLMVLPIAYLMQDETVLKDAKKLDRMEYWYWVSLFSGRYITNQNHRCAEDVAWLYQFAGRLEDYNPFARDAQDVLQQNKYSNLETLLQPEGVNKAISNGICAYVLSQKPHDFYQGKSGNLSAERVANDEKVSIQFNGTTSSIPLKLELHHIIPLGTSKTMKNVTSDLRKDKRNLLNSPLNLTYISSLANKFIGAQSPQVYLDNLYAGSITDHFIPERPKDFKVEADQKKFLGDRYHLILQDLQQHLQELCQ